MFCDHCGRELYPSAVVCPGCGCATPRAAAERGVANVSPDDKGGLLWWLLGAILASTFVPIILFVVWKDQYPKRGKAVLIGYVVGLVAIPLLIVVAYIAMMLVIIFVAYMSSGGASMGAMSESMWMIRALVVL